MPLPFVAQSAIVVYMMNTNTAAKYFNINLFVNGKYTGSNPFTGSKKAAIEQAHHLLKNSYYTRASVESKSGLIVAVVNA